MKSRFGKIIVVACTVGLITSTNIIPMALPQISSVAFAATTPAQISSQSVSIDGQSTIVVSDAHLLMQEQGKVLSFTVKYNNKGAKDLNLIDYWVRVKNKSGKSFSVKLIDQDKNKTYVAPNTSMSVTYYAIVDKQTKISDFQFDMIKWDFNVPNYERKLGTITFPTNGTDIVSANVSKTMTYVNTELKGTVKQAIINKDKTNTYLTVNIEVENVGFKSASLSTLNFAIQTDNQLVYDVDAGDLSAASIQPREKKVLTVQTIIPNTSGAKKYYLATTTVDAASKINIPIGIFALPSGTQMSATPFGKGRQVYINGQTLNTTVTDAVINNDNGKQYVYVNVEAENQGTTTIDATTLDFSIKTAAGATYTLKNSIEDMKILVGENKKIQLSIVIPASVDLKKSELLLNAKNSKSISVPIGSYALPVEQGGVSTPVGSIKTITFADQSVQTTVTDSFSNKIEGENYFFAEFSLENMENENINISEANFSLRAKDGTNYPLTYTREELSLEPGVLRSVQLSGVIPANVELKDSQLIVRLAQDSAKGFIISSYKLNEEGQEGTIGGAFTYKDFEIEVNNVQRSYLESNDLLVADITVTNTAKGSKNIPNLSGYFIVNGAKIDSAKTKTLKLDQVDSLSPKESYNYVVYAEIPYSTEINQVSFVATEVDNQSTRVLHQFSDTKTSPVAKQDKSFVYMIENTGKKSEVRVGTTAIYEDGRNQYFYAEIELTSKEKRSALLNNTAGYVQANNKAIIPLTFNTYDEKVFPDGKVLLSAVAKIPKNYYKDELILYIGQNITTDTEEDTSSNNLIQPVGFTLKNTDILTKYNDLTEVNYLGYALSIHNATASFHVRENASNSQDFDGIQLRLNYDLNQIQEYENDFEDHKLIVELVDSENKFVRYSRELTIDTLKEGADYLEVGDGNVKTIVFLDDDAFLSVTHKKYILNIYHEIDGQKLLIATKENVW